ncbi:OLC1v1008856C1 [Oldenlandia corymbosa var. corymbosa]|uniref:OLC1v1008856C1 n=1 Tax=Oldenlandia corymbosa var. corymbosa TaxID=529605 RepID=A0AAV1DMQ1_OLDCO|nr:OLC1v1008856C1 [Oldenlandia corymbosa var. corymbosa]
MAHSSSFVTLFFSLLIVLNMKIDKLSGVEGLKFADDDPTAGFVSLPLDESNFEIQRPYDVPINQRYSFVDGVHTMWVFNTDKPHSPNSNTRPRTELRIQGYDYSSGVWQFEGHGFIPSTTSGAVVMQIFGSNVHATTLMLRVYKGSLFYYNNPVLAQHIYDRWFRLNVIHDVDQSTIKVFIDGVQLFHEEDDRGGDNHFFKCGVYAVEDDDSHRMESRWKGIRVLKKM